MAMCGSGVRIIGMRIITMLLKIVLLGFREEILIGESFAAVPGLTILGFAAPLSASTIRPTPAPTISVFELSVQRPGFFHSPFLSFPLSLSFTHSAIDFFDAAGDWTNCQKLLALSNSYTNE